MPVLNKPDLIADIAKKTGNSKAETERFLNAFEETVIDSVANGTEVKISGFAAFATTISPARTMKNPLTGKDFDVPEKQVARIRPLKRFKDSVSEAYDKDKE